MARGAERDVMEAFGVFVLGNDVLEGSVAEPDVLESDDGAL